MKTATVTAFATLALLGSAAAKQVEVEATMANKVLKADAKTTTYLKVALTGFELEAAQLERAPVNVAIVFDKSSSMSGEKIGRAREAAKEAIRQLKPNDIVSVVLYDSTVKVLVSATKLNDRKDIYRKIDGVKAGGKTALFAGVSKGVKELSKYLDRNLVNRVILLSDGQANIGPSSPVALGELGASLRKDGIAVSTIGLGERYNEDLMYKLADRSDGNHFYAQNPKELAGIFSKEFGDILSVVAQEITVKIKCKPGVRPVRVLGREAEISGRDVTVLLNQIYSGAEEYVLLELEVPSTADGQTMDIANVRVNYANLLTKTAETSDSAVGVRFAASDKEVVSNVNGDVMAACVMQIATETNTTAMILRDKGQILEAQNLLVENGAWLRTQGALWNCEPLLVYGQQNDDDAKNLGEGQWSAQRKTMRYNQYQNFKSRAQKGEILQQQQAAPQAVQQLELEQLDLQQQAEQLQQSIPQPVPAK